MGPLKFGSYFLDSPVVKNNKKPERYNRFVTVVVETKTGNNRLYTVGTGAANHPVRLLHQPL